VSDIKSVVAWRDRGRHLPQFLRDFHKQKDVFKLFERAASRLRSSDLNLPSWRAAHVYTIDVFLWLMALYGWTLQRSRAHVDHEDIHAAIAAMKDEEVAALRTFLSAQKESSRG
jgi:hypothetical protein